MRAQGADRRLGEGGTAAPARFVGACHQRRAFETSAARAGLPGGGRGHGHAAAGAGSCRCGADPRVAQLLASRRHRGHSQGLCRCGSRGHHHEHVRCQPTEAGRCRKRRGRVSCGCRMRPCRRRPLHRRRCRPDGCAVGTHGNHELRRGLRPVRRAGARRCRRRLRCGADRNHGRLARGEGGAAGCSGELRSAGVGHHDVRRGWAHVFRHVAGGGRGGAFEHGRACRGFELLAWSGGAIGRRAGYGASLPLPVDGATERRPAARGGRGHRVRRVARGFRRGYGGHTRCGRLDHRRVLRHVAGIHARASSHGGCPPRAGAARLRARLRAVQRPGGRGASGGRAPHRRDRRAHQPYGQA